MFQYVILSVTENVPFHTKNVVHLHIKFSSLIDTKIGFTLNIPRKKHIAYPIIEPRNHIFRKMSLLFNRLRYVN